MANIPYNITETGISFFLPGMGQKTFLRDFSQFDDLVKAVTSGDIDTIKVLVNPRQYVARETRGNVIITEDDEVLFKNRPVPEYLASRILEHLANSIPIDPICAFAEKLMENPNASVREDLYKWLERGNMPIFSDGDFMAYKLVREDFTPIHNGPYGQDQSVGKIVEQPRETCNENRDQTCASGLHFCSYEYLPHFQSWNSNKGNVVIVLKINPRDVVAIPTDYNLSKGRTCRFEVIDTIDPNTIEESFGGKLVLNNLGTYKGDDLSSVKNGDTEKREKAEMALRALSEHPSKTAAAKSLGISRSTLSRWEKYAEELGVNIEEDDDWEDEWEIENEDSWEDDSWEDSWDD